MTLLGAAALVRPRHLNSDLGYPLVGQTIYETFTNENSRNEKKKPKGTSAENYCQFTAYKPA